MHNKDNSNTQGTYNRTVVKQLLNMERDALPDTRTHCPIDAVQSIGTIVTLKWMQWISALPITFAESACMTG